MTNVEFYNKETGEVFALGDGASNGAVLTETALVLSEDFSQDQWEDLGRKLGALNRSSMWWIGDWVRAGYGRKYGETWDKFEAITGLDQDTLRQAKRIAERFETARRLAVLSWGHYQAVATLPDGQVDEILRRAAHERLNVHRTRALVSRERTRARLLLPQHGDETCTVSDLHDLVHQGRRFGCVYLDPPWRYSNQGTRGATRKHYVGVEDDEGNEIQSADGMTVDEICALPVGELAADDAHLHLWTTNGFLAECFRLFDSWGFTFKSSFVWVKPEMGIGNYWRNSHEIMLTAVRGDATRFNDHSIKSWIECSRGAHSEKPWIVRDYLRRTSPGPHIEMFARGEAAGWTVWGNDIKRDLFSQSVLSSFEAVS